ERIPIRDNLRGPARARKASMAGDQKMKPCRIVAGEIRHDIDAAMAIEIAGLMIRSRVDQLLLEYGLKFDHGQVAQRRESAIVIEHIGNPARHAGRKISSGIAEHNHNAARHVFAAVVARALDNRDGTGIADRETLARNTSKIAFPRYRSVQHGVADD